MATGFLFLGGGRLTFGRSNEVSGVTAQSKCSVPAASNIRNPNCFIQAIAGLLVSLYPRFPQNASDNRCHLQALRHLYVLAVEDRCLDAVDVDSGKHSVFYLELYNGE